LTVSPAYPARILVAFPGALAAKSRTNTAPDGIVEPKNISQYLQHIGHESFVTIIARHGFDCLLIKNLKAVIVLQFFYLRNYFTDLLSLHIESTPLDTRSRYFIGDIWLNAKRGRKNCS
jgi:hypothetical protein